MVPETTWYTLEEAVNKYRLDTPMILKWAEDGAIRAEQPDTRAMKVNMEDLEQMVCYLKKCNLAFRDCD